MIQLPTSDEKKQPCNKKLEPFIIYNWKFILDLHVDIR